MAAHVIAKLQALLIVAALYAANATDPNPLQDFCVAANDTNGLFTNGKFCKDPATVTADDFLFSRFERGDTNNFLSLKVNLVTVERLPGLNTVAAAMARLDFAAGGVNSPHFHPRGSEILTVVEGSLYAGFVNEDLHLFSKVLKAGDIFTFPQGLVHFQINVGKVPAFAIVVFNSQNPGVVTLSNATFGTTPSVPVDVLSKAFRLDESVVEDLQSFFRGTSISWLLDTPYCSSEYAISE